MSGLIAGAAAFAALPVIFIAAALGVVAPAGGNPAQGPLAHVYIWAAQRSFAEAGCAVPAAVIAAIGQVESGHAAGRRGGADGNIQPAIIGPPLSGSGGTRTIRDTDKGTWDRDATWDRAVGPMQFLPSSWRRFGRDGNGDGVADPHNVFDATLAAAAHLCLAPPPAHGRPKNLDDPTELERALYAYNRSPAYVSRVLALAIRYADDAVPEIGAEVSGMGWAWPLLGRVTSEYGRRWGRAHEGIDIGARTGSAIYAARAGVVTAVGHGSGYGNVTILDHGGGLTTLYAHQSQVAVRRGDIVAAGERIGSVGCTGNCTGPHLHFEVRVNGSPRNPRMYLPKPASSLGRTKPP